MTDLAAASREKDFGPSGRERQSRPPYAVHKATSRQKIGRITRKVVPVRSAAAPLPSPAFLV
jgi:hypothetical protein